MYSGYDDTICAPATIPGTGAITIIRVSGPKALEIADSVVSCRQTGSSAGSAGDRTCASGGDAQGSAMPSTSAGAGNTGSPAPHPQQAGQKSGTIASAHGYTIRFGTVYDEKKKPLDDVLVSIFRAPHSYTGEDSVEISCHASKYIADSIMQLLIAAGARTAEPGEFTRRAFVNGKMDLAQAEAVADLIASQNAAAHRVAINQLKGGFSLELKKMRDKMLHIVLMQTAVNAHHLVANDTTVHHVFPPQSFTPVASVLGQAVTQHYDIICRDRWFVHELQETTVVVGVVGRHVFSVEDGSCHGVRHQRA